MFDPTKNDRPVCLMEPEDLKSLQECGGPWEILAVSGKWLPRVAPDWVASMTYRQKPQPKLWWVDTVQHGIPYDTCRCTDSEMRAWDFTLVRKVE